MTRPPPSCWRRPGPLCRPGLGRQDYEYRREGTRNLFLACEPLAGWRQVAVTQRRTMQDFAHQMRWLVDEAYPETPVVRVVLDNLNTHRAASLYETFPAADARRIAKRLEFHYTPKHGMVEYGGNRVQRAVPLCLKQRLPGGCAREGSPGLVRDLQRRLLELVSWREPRTAGLTAFTLSIPKLTATSERSLPLHNRTQAQPIGYREPGQCPGDISPVNGIRGCREDNYSDGEGDIFIPMKTDKVLVFPREIFGEVFSLVPWDSVHVEIERMSTYSS